MLSTEAELVATFRHNLHQSSHSIVIPEFDGILKRPDLVHARIRDLPETVQWSHLASVLRSTATARILSFLRLRQPRTKTYLEYRTHSPFVALSPSIRKLERLGLVELKGDSVYLIYPLSFNMVEITAYEGKLSNWRRAAQQAWSYNFYSTSSRIFMPEPAARRAMRIKREMREVGIRSNRHHRR